MSTAALPHRRRRFTGRDPDEAHRVSTPLELLYDLTIVIAFGTASDELAHMIAEGHTGAGVAGFLQACFAVSLAWLNYTWFASAYDTDDWVFRIGTVMQMAGVIVLSLGLEPLFDSIEEGGPLSLGVVVAGYVVMRVALVTLWLLVARQDPERSRTARTYAFSILVAQLAWVALAIISPDVVPGFVLFAVLAGVEVTIPFAAERRGQTPWHPHHIAERYGLLVIITLGEVIIGTVAAINALVHGEAGWSASAVLLALAGIGLTAGTWWAYFAIPWAEVLDRRRDRGFPFGYGHLLLFAAIAAIGAGLHVAAYELEGEAEISTTATVLTTAIPVSAAIAIFYLLYTIVMGTHDRLHNVLIVLSALCVGASIVLSLAGASVAVCLLVLMLAPVVTVVGYETRGHARIARSLERLERG